MPNNSIYILLRAFSARKGHIIKKFDELTITDDYMFCAVMKENPELCREFTAIILNKPVGEIIFVDQQHPIKSNHDGHGVRFDVYLGDDRDTVYDIEMQNKKRDHIEKRARYYQSMIDRESLDKGQKYAKLKTSYVIFICNFDLYNKSRIIYTFSKRCIEDSDIFMNDDAYVVFVNLTGDVETVSPELKTVINYMAGRDSDTDLAQRFDDAISQIKENETRRTDYMNLEEMLEESYNDGFENGKTTGFKNGEASGFQRGLDEGQLLTYRRLYNDHTLTADKIKNDTDMDLDDFIRETDRLLSTK